jgi:hypothetical protein
MQTTVTIAYYPRKPHIAAYGVWTETCDQDLQLNELLISLMPVLRQEGFLTPFDISTGDIDHGLVFNVDNAPTFAELRRMNYRSLLAKVGLPSCRVGVRAHTCREGLIPAGTRFRSYATYSSGAKVSHCCIAVPSIFDCHDTFILLATSLC